MPPLCEDARIDFNLAPPLSLTMAVTLAAAMVLLVVALRWSSGPAAIAARRRSLLLLRGLILLVVAAILANPVRVETRPGAIERPKVIYLLDASQSMSLGREKTRWDEALGTIRDAQRLLSETSRPDLSVYRFGQRLSAVEPDRVLAPARKEAKTTAAGDRLAPTDMDTQLLSALRQLPGRFYEDRPTASMVVLFSDGQVHNPAGLEEIGRRYARMGMPIHVVPCGRLQGSGDVALESLVAPMMARKHAVVPVVVYVRSYGFDGGRAELRLSAVDRQGRADRQLDRAAITLRSGVHPFVLHFQSGMEPLRIEASVEPQPGEISTENNRLASEVLIDRTKIRILYLVGSLKRRVLQRQTPGAGARPAPRTRLEEALAGDEDLECVVYLAQQASSGSRSSGLLPVSGSPFANDAEVRLFAYDAVVFDNVAASAVPPEIVQRLEEFVSVRGGGFCMVGGPESFGSGGWHGSGAERLLPVALDDASDWRDGPVVVQPVATEITHPIWNLTSDDRLNRSLLASLPPTEGYNRTGPLKPSAATLATASEGPPSEPAPVIAVESFGRGRTAAIAAPLAERWDGPAGIATGETGLDTHAKFWRNVVYWLTENSEIGRRRLLVESDKRLYRPGESIQLKVDACDDAGKPTTAYRVVVTVEPANFSDNISDTYSPVQWPEAATPTDVEAEPFVPWGEELAMAVRGDGKSYELGLPIAEAGQMGELGTAAVHSLRIEAAAYEDFTQVDSTSIDLQVLNDPDELQSPLPDHGLLERLAAASGGEVLKNPRSLAAKLGGLPFRQGPPMVTRTPLWSKPWLLVTLLFTLTVDWLWRRRVGLA